MMEKVTFNDYLYETYGIYADDLTDEDYDELYKEYKEALIPDRPYY